MKFLKLLLFVAFSVFFAGCTGYQLGSTLPDGVETVFIKVVNNTDEPSVEVAVMKALRSEILFDGSLDLVETEEKSDAVLYVELSNFYLQALAFDRNRGELAQEYRMVIYSQFVLYRPGAEKSEEMGEENVILQSPAILGEAEFPYAADLTTAKLGVMPDASEDLARQIISMITSAWPRPDLPMDEEAAPDIVPKG